MTVHAKRRRRDTKERVRETSDRDVLVTIDEVFSRCERDAGTAAYAPLPIDPFYAFDVVVELPVPHVAGCDRLRFDPVPRSDQPLISERQDDQALGAPVPRILVGLLRFDDESKRHAVAVEEPCGQAFSRRDATA